MTRVLLVHWKAEEAQGRLAELGRLGFQASHLGPEGMSDLRALSAEPPAAIIIDLSRLPSHGRVVATALRQQKATRRVPLLFAGGATDKVEAARALLPDAVFTGWEKIGAALNKALRDGVPAQPVVPGRMAGYSGTPLWRKLGIREGVLVGLLGAPAGFQQKLKPLPAGVRFARRASRDARVSILFATRMAELKKGFAAAQRALGDGAALWIGWPKKASGRVTDLSANSVRAFGLAEGWVDYKICAIDETWSGLCFCRRREKGGGGK
jgi:hypothetical protein